MRFKLPSNKIVRLEQPFEYEGVQYPSYWLRDKESRKTLGAVEIIEESRPDTRLGYANEDHGTDTGAGGEVRGNYATLNPLAVNGGTFSQGNLGYVGATAFKAPLSTIKIPSTGKWQMEAVMTGTPAGAAWANIWSAIGVCTTAMATTTWDTANTVSVIVADVGKYHNFSTSDVNYNGGSALTAADVLTLVVDRDANTFDIYINGTQKTSSPTIGTTAGVDLFFFLAGYGSTRYLSDVNFGQRAFTVDANAKALCTKNLPEPDTYWANGADPDLIWIKGRSGATDHVLVDTTRGPTLGIGTNLTSAEAAAANVLSWSKYGARVGNAASVNTSAATYVAHLFKKQAGFFDVVSYTGNGSARTISHSLGVTPEMMIVKRRTTAGGAWAIYHSGQGATKYAEFSTAAFATNSNRWNDTAPTGSVFSVGTGADVNNNGDTLVNYLFASVPGLCKIGSYTGNGSADGPFVWCGFKPRWLLVKRTDSSGAWDVWDAARSPFNVVDDALVPDTAAVEDVNNANLAVDFLSNGFKMRASHAYVNASGGTYIFMALADTDFKFARAA